MNRRVVRLVLATGLALTTALSVLAAVNLRSGGALPTDAAGWAAAVQACDPGGAGEITEEKGPVQECLTRVLVRATDGGRQQDVLDALDEAQNGRLGLICHTAAHLAGAKVSLEDGLMPVIERVNTAKCQGGLFHGVFDGMAKKSISVELWKELASWCLDSRRSPASANCSDAMGHAAYDANGGNVQKSFYICRYLHPDENNDSPAATYDCAEGILMQEYRPASRPEYRVAVPDGEFRALCSNLPTRVWSEKGVRHGCYRGIGFLAGSQMALDRPVSGTPITDRALAQNQREALHASEICRLAAVDDIDLSACLDRLYQVIAYSGDEEWTSKVCALLGDLRTKCEYGVDQYWFYNRAPR